jgi:hypothetical protein
MAREWAARTTKTTTTTVIDPKIYFHIVATNIPALVMACDQFFTPSS